MTIRLKVLLILLAITIAFAGGRYSARSEDTNETTKTTDSQKNQEKHEETTEVIVKQPDGATTTTRKTVTDTRTDTKRSSDTISKDSKTSETRSIVTISGLVGADTRDNNHLYYGALISKEVAGPISVGVFGLNNGLVGISLGLDF